MKSTFFRGLVGAGLLAFAASTNAQSVIESSPTPAVVPTSLRDSSGPSLAFLDGGLLTDLPPLHYGVFQLRPHVYDSFTEADGLLSARGMVQSTHINSFSPGLLADIGSHWTIDYTPTWRNYSNPNFEDTVEHSLQIAGGQAVGDWLVQFHQGYSYTNSSDLETGGQTGRENFITQLDASRRFNSKISLDTNVSQNLQYLKGLTNSYDWSTTEFINYQVEPRMNISAGLQVGYTDFDPGSSAFYYTPQVRFGWQFTDKLAVNANFGYEHRKTNSTGVPDENVPIYGATVTYQPFTYTGLNFSVNRVLMPSYYQNSTSDNTNWSMTLGQRLLGRFFLSATYAGSSVHYEGTGVVLVPQTVTQNVVDGSGNVIGTVTNVVLVPTAVETERNDSFHSVSLKLSTTIFQRGSFAILYRTNHNVSDTGGYSLSSREIGCEVGYRF